MNWVKTNRSDYATRLLADRHYSRKTIGAKQFVPPGRCLVLLTKKHDAYWVTSWPYAEYVKHAWAGAWLCSAFRNEGSILSSQLISEAVACTRWRYGDAPALGMITFVNHKKVRSKKNPGYCFIKAGFEHVGFTKGGLYTMQLLPEKMPPPESPSLPLFNT